MGWKNVKEHYQIKHQVAVYDGEGICIGSPLCHDLIIIDRWRKTVKHTMTLRGNEDLERYWDEMHADLDKLWALIEQEDTFSSDIPVFTWKGEEVIEKSCETPGYPNVTHDGELMYENRFSTDRGQALQWAIEDAEAGIRMGLRRLDDLSSDVAKARKLLEDDRFNLGKLRHEQILEQLNQEEGEPK
jgi:hypothetical protein